MPQIGVVLVIKLVEIQLYIYTEYLHVIYQIYIYILKKKSHRRFENPYNHSSWKNISKLQWPQDSARFKFAQELKTFHWKAHCVSIPVTFCTSQTLMAKIYY